MNWFTRLFSRPKPAPAKKAPPPKPEEKPFEPSCLAKGIAKAWIDDRDGWTIKRKKVVVQYYGSGGSGDRTYMQVQLTHPKLGIRIQGSEQPHRFWGVSAFVNEETRVWESYNQCDSSYLADIITANPYPILKRDIDKHAKAEATRAAKIAAIESLGCPS